MTDQYTPTTEQIELLVLGQLKQSAEKRGIPVDVEADRADFRHWLAERDARIESAAEQRGAERAFKESAKEVRREMRWQYMQNINRNSDTGDSIDRLLELEKVFKYRADQMEGDDETH